jgi:hypothetical protein
MNFTKTTLKFAFLLALASGNPLAACPACENRSMLGHLWNSTLNFFIPGRRIAQLADGVAVWDKLDQEEKAARPAAIRTTDIVKASLDAGFGIDDLVTQTYFDDSTNEVTLLYLAAEYGCYDICYFLLEKGASVDKYNNHNNIFWMTPLQIAIKNGHLEVAQLLIARGGAHVDAYALKYDANEITHDEQSASKIFPTLVFAQDDASLRMLLAHGANPTLTIRPESDQKTVVDFYAQQQRSFSPETIALLEQAIAEKTAASLEEATAPAEEAAVTKTETADVAPITEAAPAEQAVIFPVEMWEATSTTPTTVDPATLKPDIRSSI